MRISPELQAWIRREIDAQPPDGALGNWPRELMKEHDVLLIHGDNATLWFIGLDGTLYSLDPDRVARKLEPKLNRQTVREVLATAAQRLPQLAELSLTMELEDWFSTVYAPAFSSKSVARVLPFYKPNALVRLHRDGRPLRVWTGSTLGAIRRLAVPAELMLRVAFRQLAKRDYDRSTATLLAASPDGDGAKALVAFDRIDRAGATFESVTVAYRLERTANGWVISEGWLSRAVDAYGVPNG